MKISTPVAVAIIALFLVVVGVVGYQQYESALGGGVDETTAESTAYPPYHTEQGWTVQQVGQFIADLGALADGGAVQAVEAKVIPTSGGSSRYTLSAGKRKETISLADGVWNPATYAKWAKAALGDAAARATPNPEGAKVVEELLKPDFKTFFALNGSLSQQLQANPRSATLHVKAALLLGTIALNDYAGCFRDTRPELNRIVAHLAVADALGAMLEQPERQLAEAIRLTLCDQQADALKLIEGWAAGAAWNAPSYHAWATILRLRNTDDWRDKSAVAAAGPEALQYELFRALAYVTTVDKAGEFLEQIKGKPSAAYCRIANESSLSVQYGHYFTQPWFKMEIAEAFAGVKGFQIPEQEDKIAMLAEYLDTPAGSPVLVGADGKPVVQIAGRNLFASYHQRHLVESLNRTYAFLHDKWGVEDSARELKAFITDKLPALRYKPFLLRLTARHPGAQAETNQACFQIIQEQTPIVTPTLWARLNMNEDGDRLSLNVPDFHPWFRPEVPAGTAYEIDDRMYDIGVGDENDMFWLKELRARAPYSNSLARQMTSVANGGTLTKAPTQTIIEYSTPMVDYEYRAMRLAALSCKDQPALYEEWMLKLATLDSDAYLELAAYYAERKMDEQAAKYYLIAFEKAQDRVYMANSAQWIVSYLYAKGDVDMATKIAADAAEVYSAKGLDTYIWLMEKLGKWDEALKTARDSDERYGGNAAELACLIRQRAASPQLAESPRYQEVMGRVFPDGLQQVDIATFTAAPKRGVLVNGDSRSLRAFGLKNQNVIVALNGYRTDTFTQYKAIRDLKNDLHLRVIAWDGQKYTEKEGDVARKLFGVDMIDYRAE